MNDVILDQNTVTIREKKKSDAVKCQEVFNSEVLRKKTQCGLDEVEH